ncbi:MAG: SMC family ATPase [Candidatus Woesearchaeota archaeon]
MLIKRVKLHNIRSYSEEEFIFPEGSILLSGDIGSGKSSILLAIEFALFGATNEISPNSLLRKGKNQGSVELEFEIEGKNFIIKRSLKRSSEKTVQTSGYLIIDNIKKELTPVEMKNEIIRILGYPLSLASKKKSLIYRFTVYTPQEQMKQILFEKSDERLDTIRKLFGIDRYKTIIENSQIILNYLKEKISEESIRAENLEQKKQELNDLKAQRTELEKSLKTIEKELLSLNNKLDSENKDYNLIKENYNKSLELKKNLEVINSMIEEKKKQISIYREKIETIEKEISLIREKIKGFSVKENKEEIKLKIKKKEDEIEKIKNEVFSSQKEIEILNNKILELNSEILKKNSLENEIQVKKKSIEEKKLLISKENTFLEKKKEIDQKISSIRNDLISKKALISNLKNVIKTLNSSKKCPLCMQEITDSYKEKLMKENNEIILKTENEILDLEKSEKELNREFLEINDKLNEISEQKIQLAKETEQFNKLNEELSLLLQREVQLEKTKEEIKKLNQKLKSKEELEVKTDELKKLKNDLELINDFEKHSALLVEKDKEKNSFLKQVLESEAEIKNHTEKIDLIKKELKNFEGIENKLKEKEKIVEELKKEQKELEIKKASLTKEISMIDTQLKRVSEEIQKILEAKEKLNKLKSFKYWIEEHFTNIILLMEKQVMSSLHYEFNELFKEWFNMLMGDETITARLDEDFTPIVEQNNYEIEIESLSGGEKTSLALAYRLALNKVINDITHGIKTKDIIILDEPTDGFSSQQLDKVRDVIKALDMKQVIIVSHEQKIESFVDTIIRIAKENGISRIIS